MFLFAFIFLFACQTNNRANADLFSENEIDTSGENNSLTISDSDLVEYIKEPCVCFFSMSNEEYEQFLISSNVNVKWEFDNVFKKFKRETKSARTSLKKNNINSFYIVKPNIAFISKQNDTIFFKRKDEDYFIGQIFYSGYDSIIIEEGLMKIDQLEEKIESFFKLSNNFKIKAVYEKVDTGITIKKDTIKAVLPDTIE